ncbi:MAG: hypothetical protein IPH07_23665 [Deltaproteobacteria bacterium]|nr:hypothetical protein [Deltaproteobacteria bacterium]MBK8720679.1 hypothetical protein [Deltaproteobacteria bacterium]
MQHRVIYNEGAQTLRHVPVDRRGHVVAVGSATYTLVDLRETTTSGDRVLASGSATVGAVSTLLTTAAGAGVADPTLVAVTSATGITAGHTYAIQAIDGRTESFVVERVSGLNVYLAHELVGDYTTADSVVSVEITASFPSTPAADETSLWDGGGPYQITWEYTIGDQLYLVPEIIWLTRYSVQPFVTPHDVLLAYPTLGSRARLRATIDDAIAAATQDYVAECESASKDPTLFRATALSKVAVRERAIAYVLDWCGEAEPAQKHEDAWRRYMNQILVGVPKTGSVTVSRNDDTAAAGTTRRQQQRFIRRS